MIIKAFHGTGSFINKFNLDYLSSGEHQYGAGIYFAQKRKDTEYYSKGYGENNTDGNTYKVELNIEHNEILKESDEKIVSNSLIKYMIENSPIKDEMLTNFGDVDYEGYDKVLNISVNAYKGLSIYEFFKIIDNDFYGDNSKKCLELFSNKSNYKMIEINSNGHIIYNVINPEIINIKMNLNYEAERKNNIKMELEEKNRTKIKEFLSEFNSVEEMKKRISFHGTGEQIKGKIRVGGYDEIFWTTDTPQIAQTYISDFSTKTFSQHSNYELEESIHPFNSSQVDVLNLLGYEIIGKKNNYGGYDSYHLEKNGERCKEFPKKIELQKLFFKYNYFAKDNMFKIKFNDNNEIVNNNERRNGHLCIIKTKSDLNIKDISTGEGDLMDVQYHNLEEFKSLNRKGYDGIKIDDFAQSNFYGNVMHDSVGLTQQALDSGKIEILMIPVKRDDFSNDTSKDRYKTKDVDIVNVMEEIINERKNLNISNDKNKIKSLN